MAHFPSSFGSTNGISIIFLAIIIFYYLKKKLGRVIPFFLGGWSRVCVWLAGNWKDIHLKQNLWLSIKTIDGKYRISCCLRSFEGGTGRIFLAFLPVIYGINWPSTFYICNCDEPLWKCHKVNHNLPCCCLHAHKKVYFWQFQSL